MYKRLTERISDNQYALIIPDNAEISDLEIKFNAYDKLGRFEDLEEQLIAHTGVGLKKWIAQTTSLFDVNKEVDDFEADCERLIAEKEHINTTTKMACQTRIGIMERLEICDEIVSMVMLQKEDYKQRVSLLKIIEQYADVESIDLGNTTSENISITIGDITIRIGNDKEFPCKCILNPQGLHNQTEDIVTLSKALFEDKLNNIEDEKLLSLYEETDDYILDNQGWKDNLSVIKYKWQDYKDKARLQGCEASPCNMTVETMLEDQMLYDMERE